MPKYVAIVDGSDDLWACRVPDFPGCKGGGSTPDDAIANAKSALRARVHSLLDEGGELPAPSRLDEIRATIKASGGSDGEAVYLWVWGR